MRNITSLRNSFTGKLYIFLSSEEIASRFLSDAQAGGFHFGDILPEDNHFSDIIAIEPDQNLSYVGIIGRIAFQSGNAVGIDYGKYINGQGDYTVRYKGYDIVLIP